MVGHAPAEMRVGGEEFLDDDGVDGHGGETREREIDTGVLCV